MSTLPAQIALCLATAAVLTLVVGGIASAQQPPCGPYQPMADHLADKYGETVQSRGVMAGGLVMLEVWANPETGTWTAMRRGMDRGQHVACIMAGGEGYHEPQAVMGEPL